MKQVNDQKIHQLEIIVKKSRFITYIKKITSQSDFEAFKAECFKRDAKHNCFAYRYHVNNSETQGYHNDGEPGGTSGDILLRFIDFNGLSNIGIYVVRYFGGVKLGVGPLARAYVQGAKELIRNDITLQEETTFTVSFKVKINNQKAIIGYLNKNNLEYTTNFNQEEITFEIATDHELDLAEIQHLIY